MNNVSTPWLQTSLASAIIGGFFALLVFGLGCLFNIKIQEKSSRKNFLILLIQQYNHLFSIIVRGAEDPNHILYKLLRQELDKNSGIIFLVPKELKKPFTQLIKIHYNSDIGYYQKNKGDIVKYFQQIVKILNEFGVDLFGLK